MLTSGLATHSAGSLAKSLPTKSEHQAQQGKDAFPVFGGRVRHRGIDDLERPRKRDTEAAIELRQELLGLLVERDVRRWPRYDLGSSMRISTVSSSLSNSRIRS